MVFVYPLVEDRKINTRHQLRVMGMDMRAYWLSAFVADYLLSAFVGLALVAVIGGFGIGAQQCAPAGVAGLVRETLQRRVRCMLHCRVAGMPCAVRSR